MGNPLKCFALCSEKNKNKAKTLYVQALQDFYGHRSRTASVPVTFASLVSTMSSSQSLCLCRWKLPCCWAAHKSAREGVRVEPWPGQTSLLPQNNTTTVWALDELCV